MKGLQSLLRAWELWRTDSQADTVAAALIVFGILITVWWARRSGR
jgi:hypothetical protein